ncbi:MAG: hypothetical protein MRJ65_08805 [Candidatus Brocadiaceae bacterium]|nr:hypothetical protein [Candidatus Brocadiaceae bacterium]
MAVRLELHPQDIAAVAVKGIAIIVNSKSLFIFSIDKKQICYILMRLSLNRIFNSNIGKENTWGKEGNVTEHFLFQTGEKDVCIDCRR